MPLYSHLFEDGTRLGLKEHLQSVAQISAELVSDKKLSFSIPQKIIEEIAYLIGICHDFGKATSFFQEDRLKKNAKNEKTGHSKLSAFWSYIIIKKHLEKVEISRHWSLFFRLIVPYIIERHHSLLEDLEHIKNLDPEFIEYLKQNLNRGIFGYSFNYKGLNVSFDLVKSEFENMSDILHALKKDYREFTKVSKSETEEVKLERIILLLFLFSILMEADKARLILEEKEYKKELTELQYNSEIVDSYKEKKFGHMKTGKLNRLKEEAHQDVIRQVSQLDLNKFIYSLNLPTGLGKTLTSLSFALGLRQRLGKKYKIIYSLPFLGIIEQTEDVFEDVFGELFKKYGQSLLLKHHSLSEIKYKSPAFDEEDIEKSEFLINIWNSQILLTTFDQVLYSIFSQDRSFLMRFHNLFNSIVIFDEIQSIPYKLWLLLSKFFKVISKVGNSYFILMTATKPLIFKENEMKELISDVPYYFNQLHRVILYSRIEEERSLNDFLTKIVTQIVNNNPKKDIMIVMNTINSSLIVYDFVKKDLNKERDLIYLSTNIIPKDRMARIEKIRQKKEKGDLPEIIVTTQCIEAGVDIDADIILRDFAPMDCINQVCGRANRHGLRERGEVWIYRLKDGTNGKYFSSYIYDSILLNATEELLKGKRKIRESEFLKLNREYFPKVKSRAAFNEAKKIIEAICLMKFSEIDIRKLLRADDAMIDIFVKKDEESERILAKYKEALLIKDWKKRKRLLLDLRKGLFTYTISIYKRIKRKGQVYFPEKSAEEIENDGYYIEKEYYNEDIGFDPTNILRKSTTIF